MKSQKIHQPRRLVFCKFLPYHRARNSKPRHNERWIDVSSSGEPPLDQLSPFFPHGGIPIPGSEKRTADSVEGIWQGLKVIRGKTAPRFFQGTGRKRGGGKPAGHQWGTSDRLLGLVEARQKIYVPAYEWMLNNCIDPPVIDQLINRAFQGVPQFFYDREDNGSIGKDAPLAHAKVLVEFLNQRITQMIAS